MADFSAPGAAEAAAHAAHTSRIPTHYLGGPARAQSRPCAGFSGTLPRLPSLSSAGDEAERAAEAVLTAHRATQRRRRLLAIFGRMMARFHERHERRWSMGRWECSLCRHRIMAWAWLPRELPGVPLALHEECVSRSMWDVVLHHERAARAPDAAAATLGILI